VLIDVAEDHADRRRTGRRVPSIDDDDTLIITGAGEHDDAVGARHPGEAG
jgi:hypothetical protein